MWRTPEENQAFIEYFNFRLLSIEENALNRSNYRFQSIVGKKKTIQFLSFLTDFQSIKDDKCIGVNISKKYIEKENKFI